MVPGVYKLFFIHTGAQFRFVERCTLISPEIYASQDRFELCVYTRNNADACTRGGGGLLHRLHVRFQRAEMSAILMSSRGRFTGTGPPSSFSFSLSLFLSLSVFYPFQLFFRGDERGESFVVLKGFLRTINRRQNFE